MTLDTNQSLCSIIRCRVFMPTIVLTIAVYVTSMHPPWVPRFLTQYRAYGIGAIVDHIVKHHTRVEDRAAVVELPSCVRTRCESCCEFARYSKVEGDIQ